MNFDFIEIGTSDFDTLIEKCNNNEVGLCVEPLNEYLRRLPDKPKVIKANYALSDTSGYAKIFYVKPQDIVKYNLPNWVRGCNSLNFPHPTIKKLLGDKHDNIIKVENIHLITWRKLISLYKIESIKYLKIDTEGHDGVILEEYYKECIKNPSLLANTILFENNVLSNKSNIKSIISLFINLGYKGIPLGDDYKLEKI